MEANWRSENPPKYIKASDLVRDYDGNYYIHAKKLEAFEAKPSDVDDDFEGANYIFSEELKFTPTNRVSHRRCREEDRELYQLLNQLLKN